MLVLACPMCKEMLLDPEQAQAVGRAARGYLISIATLIGIPLLLVGGVTTLILRGARRSR